MNYDEMNEQEILREIGRRLRRERLNRNLTQQKLAEMTGVAAADIVKGGEAVDDLLAGGKAAKGMWDSLLWLALLALIVEPVIANRLSGGPIEEPGEGGEVGAAK